MSMFSKQMNKRVARAALVLICVSGATGALAATPVEGPPPVLDLTRYFASPEAAKADLDACAAAVSALQTHQADGPAELLAILTEANQLYNRLRRHTEYGRAALLRDIEDTAARIARAAARRELVRLDEWVSKTLESYGEARYTEARRTEPGLHRYAYAMRKIQNEKDHALPPEAEALAAGVIEPAAERYWLMYQHLEAATPFGTIDTAQGQKHPRTDFDELMRQPNRELRQRTWEQYWGAYAKMESVYADILLGVVQLTEQRKRMAGYPDAANAKYEERGLSYMEVQAAFEQIRAHADLYRRYQTAWASHFERAQGVFSAEAWDLQASAVTPRRWTLAEGRTLGLAALAGLGKEYQTKMQALLDPANGRSDIAFVKGRRGSDNTSIAAAGVPTGLFVEQYRGGPRDVETMMHEAGHAIHRQYMYEAGQPAFYLSGPSWLTEAVATLNSFLVLDHLAATAQDKAERVQARETFIRKLNFELFESAQEGILEQSIYGAFSEGKLNNAAQLNALTLKVWSEFDLQARRHPEMGRLWMSKRLYVNDPYYLFNYLFSGALAAKMFLMVKQDPTDFERRFLPLLRSGFSAPPAKLLEQFFGQPVSQAQLIQDAMRFYEHQLRSLETEYATQ